MKKKILPTVVIFGRTNVGKSTLFNCLTEKRHALISDIAGTTRDSNVSDREWNGKKFTLIDTGGILETKNLSLSKKRQKTTKQKLSGTIEEIDFMVQKQARDFLAQADLILFLVDTKIGILPQDKEMAMALKNILPSTKHAILVANKADSSILMKDTAEFNKLALGEPQAISAATGSGTGDLLDLVIKRLKIRKKNEVVDERPIINVCIIGKPNVGKSSLMNKIVGSDRMIVSPVPHTTREPMDIKVEYKNTILNFIDTAGISRKGQLGARQKKKSKTLEKFSIDKSLTTVKKADIALLVIDINEGITRQESRIIEEIISTGSSLVLIANKWDLVEEKDTKAFTRNIHASFPFVRWAPIQFTSAKTGSKLTNLLDLVISIGENRKIEVSDSILSKILAKIIKIHKPAKASGAKHPHIFELTQSHVNPPRFTVRIGSKDTLHFSYIRFIENRLREKFGFIGTPVKIDVINNKKVHGKHEITK